MALQRAGYKVTGSDWAIYPPMSEVMAQSGIDLKTKFSEANVESCMDWVVVGSRIKRGNPELEAALRLDLNVVSLPVFLAQVIMPGRRCLMVAGTNGKSTTTSMLAWILKQAGHDPGYLIGGLSEHFPEPFHIGSSEFFVLEGDEYGSSLLGDLNPKFLHYRPEAVALLNVCADHPDFYRTPADVFRAFHALMARIPPQGMLAVNANDDGAWEITSSCHCQMVSVGTTERANHRLEKVQENEEGSSFTFQNQSFFIPLAGEMNRINAMLATSLAMHVGVPIEACAEALKSFTGVKERQQLMLQENTFTHVQDMVYHPQSLKLMLEATRQRYTGRRLVLVFQPRITGPRHWPAQSELPQAMTLADAVFLLPAINPVPLDAGKPFSLNKLARDVRALGVKTVKSDQVVIPKKKLQSLLQPGDVVVSCLQPSRRRALTASINESLLSFPTT